MSALTSVAPLPTTCANCGAPLAGPYCATCGQKAAPSNPTIGDLLHELSHELLHVDGKIFRTLKLLVVSPGRLTREFVDGRRTRYVSPLRVYLTLSLVYFGVAALTPGTSLWITVKAKGTSGFSFQTQPEVRQSSAEELRRLGFENQAELSRTAGEAIQHWTPRAMFLLVPLFALLVAGTLRRSRRNYPQHLYFALHVHAAWFLMLSGATLLAGAISARAVGLAMPLLMLTYLALALRQAYELSTAASLWRAVAVAGIYAIVLIATLAAIVLPAVFRHASPS